MQDYGFDFWELFYKATITIMVPNENDFYNPSDPYFGNSALKNLTTVLGRCPKQGDYNYVQIDWLVEYQTRIDLRIAALKCTQ